MKPKRRWQNLYYGRCPNCGDQFEIKGIMLVCPRPHMIENDKQCFVISKDRIREYLTNEEHPAFFCLTQDEKETIPEALAGMGISSEVYGLGE